MSITDKLVSLGHTSRRLNEGSDHLNRTVARIDRVLGELMIGLDYVYPKPLREQVHVDGSGKRVIELCYLGFLKVQNGHHLAVKTVKVLESRLSAATEDPGRIVPLLQAQRTLRHRAVDVLPDMISGLAAETEEVVASLERRCATADALLSHLEGVAQGEGPPAANREAPQDRGGAPGSGSVPSEAGERRQTGEWPG